MMNRFFVKSGAPPPAPSPPPPPASFLGILLPTVQHQAFGIPLETAARRTHLSPEKVRGRDRTDAVTGDDALRHIPGVAFRCLEYLQHWGKQEEGLYRIPGSSNQIAKLRAIFDGGVDIDLKDIHPGDLDPHAVASLFKAWLRDIPDGLFPRSALALFETLFDDSDVATKIQASLSRDASPAQFYLSRALVYHLHYLSRYSATNKMSLTNLRLILSPTLKVSPAVLQFLVNNREMLFAHYAKTNSMDTLKITRLSSKGSVASSQSSRSLRAHKSRNTPIADLFSKKSDSPLMSSASSAMSLSASSLTSSVYNPYDSVNSLYSIQYANRFSMAGGAGSNTVGLDTNTPPSISSADRGISDTPNPYSRPVTLHSVSKDNLSSLGTSSSKVNLSALPAPTSKVDLTTLPKSASKASLSLLANSGSRSNLSSSDISTAQDEASADNAALKPSSASGAPPKAPPSVSLTSLNTPNPELNTAPTHPADSSSHVNTSADVGADLSGVSAAESDVTPRARPASTVFPVLPSPSHAPSNLSFLGSSVGMGDNTLTPLKSADSAETSFSAHLQKLDNRPRPSLELKSFDQTLKSFDLPREPASTSPLTTPTRKPRHSHTRSLSTQSKETVAKLFTKTKRSVENLSLSNRSSKQQTNYAVTNNPVTLNNPSQLSSTSTSSITLPKLLLDRRPLSTIFDWGAFDEQNSKVTH